MDANKAPPSENPYLQYRGLTAEQIAAKFELDDRAGRISNLENARKLMKDAEKVGLGLECADPRTRAEEAERKGRFDIACVWYELMYLNLDPTDPEDKEMMKTPPLRLFVVSHGLLNKAEQYFRGKLTSEERLLMVEANLAKCPSFENQMYDVFKALRHCPKTEERGRLAEQALAFCLEKHRIDLAEKAVKFLGRDLTSDEVAPIVIHWLHGAVHDGWNDPTVKLIKKYKLNHLKDELLTAMAKRYPEEQVRRWAKRLGVRLGSEALEILLARAEESDDVERMLKLAYEFPHHARAKKANSPEIYARAKEMALAQGLPLAQIEKYARRAGKPLSIDDLLGYWKKLIYRMNMDSRNAVRIRLAKSARLALKRAGELIFAAANS